MELLACSWRALDRLTLFGVYVGVVTSRVHKGTNPTCDPSVLPDCFRRQRSMLFSKSSTRRTSSSEWRPRLCVALGFGSARASSGSHGAKSAKNAATLLRHPASSVIFAS